MPKEQGCVPRKEDDVKIEDVSLVPITAGTPLCLLNKATVLLLPFFLHLRFANSHAASLACSPCGMTTRVIYDKETRIYFIGSL